MSLSKPKHEPFPMFPSRKPAESKGQNWQLMGKVPHYHHYHLIEKDVYIRHIEKILDYAQGLEKLQLRKGF